MKEKDESSKCSANKYSAYQMRVASKACYEAGHRTVAGMLQQAAEVMEREEREKKWEYSVRTPTGWIDEEATQNTLEDIKIFCEEGSTIVRRSVGEWEEVDDVQQ